MFLCFRGPLGLLFLVLDLLAIVGGVPVLTADAACTIDNLRAYSGMRVQRQWSVAAAGQGRTHLFQKPKTPKLSGFLGIEPSIDADIHSTKSQPPTIVIVSCINGREDTHVTVPQGVPLFNQTHCAGTSCFRVARRMRYTDRDQIAYMPGRLVGAIYNVTKNEDGTEAFEPLTPLISENWNNYISVMGGTRVNARLNLLRSPDVPEKSYPRSDSWKEHLSPLEIYDDN